MKELFDRLDLGHPGLERVRAEVERGNLAAAGDELLAYHQARRRERCLDFWDMSGPEDYPAMPWGAASSHEQLWKNDPGRVLEGVLFASGQVFDFSTDRAIDWTSNTIWAGDKYAPVSQPRCMLRRMYWLRPLDLGFLKGDPATREKAARQFTRLMESWLAFEGFVKDEFVLQRAIRIGDPISQSGLTRSWYAFLPSHLVPADLKLRLLLNIAEGADEVLERAAWHPWAWGLCEASGLGYAGILFPEFKRAPVWRERCFAFANRFFQTELRPDGTLRRMHFCPHYAGGTAAWPLAFYPQIAKLGYDNVLEPGARAGIERLAGWIATVLKPDNTVPQITASDIQGFGRWLKAGAAAFRRPDWLHVATGGREGTPPAATSVILPDAGAFVLRDGYSRDSMVACLHNGDYHNTERTSLAIDLYALGRTLVTAPGRYGYYTPEWLPYFATAGYNSLMVDGSPHQEWGEHPLRQGSGLTDAAWRLGADVDWAWGSHPTGFDAAPQVRWQRGLLFVKGAYWLVVDRMTGPGGHAFSLRWLLTPSKAVVEPGGLNVHTEEADASVLLAPALPPGSRLALREGSREPLRGWYSPENGTMMPAPQLEYTWSGGLPSLAAMLIVPYRGARPGYSVSIEHPGPHLHDIIVRGNGAEDRLSLDLAGNGSASLERFQAGGKRARIELTPA